MTWVKLDDQFFQNRKVIDLSKGAKLIYLGGLSYASAQLTDGVLTPAAVRMVCAMVDADRSEADALVDAGLWDRTDEGFTIHDYLKYNRPADDVRAEREAARERMKRLRSGEVQPNNVRTAEEVQAPRTYSRTKVDREPVPKVRATPRARAAAPAVVGSAPYRYVSIFLEESGKDATEAPQSWIDEQCAHAEALIAAGCTEAQIHVLSRYVLSQTWRTSPVNLKAARAVFPDWLMDGEPERERSRGSPNGRRKHVPDFSGIEDFNAIMDRRETG